MFLVFFFFFCLRPGQFNCVTFLFQLKPGLVTKVSHLHFAALQALASSYLSFYNIA